MKEKISILSILANIFLAGGKLLAGFLSGSTAVFAEGLHSGMDIFSSAISYIGIKISKKPVDEKHPYGHYKFEVMAGLIITVILFITGFFIVLNAFSEFKNPSSLDIGYLALGVMFASTIINEIMARLKIYYGKKENSIALLSDGVHSRVDVYASLVVLIGLFFTDYWIYADSVLAMFVGLYIIKESFELGREAVDSLLDVSAGEKIEQEIIRIAKEFGTEIISLKTQQRGSATTANFSISLPSNLSLEEATNKSGALRKKLIDNIESLEYVAIQIESHEVETSFFKSSLIEDLNWQRKSRFKDKIPQAQGKGPEGYCICKKCEYKTEHKKGVPCPELKCPICGMPLVRE